jgi:tetratricopeptide (TPR) repeat protein
MRGSRAAAAATILALWGAVTAGPPQAVAAPAAAPTIKDLESQQIEVNTEPPRGVDASKTMESYRRFLDLNAGDAALRAEALRRLGDLNLESSESERIERELVTNEGLRATEAIHLYSALLAAYPKYERNDAVLYQLARAYELNAQPDKALASLDRLVASYPGSRVAVLGEVVPAERVGLPGRDQDRSRIALLQPKPLQARMVAVQAGRKRAQPEILCGRARLDAGGQARPVGAGRNRDLEPAESRTGRGHLPRHVHHVLVPGRAENHR